MRPLALPRLVALALGLGLCAPAAASAAEQFAGVTADNQLVFFRSDSPGNLQGAVTVSGLQTGETLLSIAWAPTAQRLYGLGSTNRLYTINPVTGAATPVSNIPFTPPLNGTSFAFGIDPSTQLARSYSSTSQNLRISVANGQVAGVDAAYAYEASDPGTGATPVLGGLAYTQPPTGGGAALLYAIDTGRDTLVTAPTQAATLRTIGALGVDAAGPVGLTLTNAVPTATGAPAAAGTTTGTSMGTSTGTATAYAAISPGTGETPRLYTIDLSTGAATPVNTNDRLATIAYRTASTATSNTPIIALAALGSADDDATRPTAVLAVSSAPKATTLRSRGLPFTVSCNEACSVSAVLKVGKHALKPVTGAILATAGAVKLTAKLDSTAKSKLKQDPSQGFSLKVTTTDAAGNTRTITASGATR